MGPRDHVGVAEIGSINWLSFPKRVSFFKLMHVFKISKGLAPSYLLDRFTRTSAVHSYSSRGSDVNYYWSDVNRSTNIFTHSSIKEWNALPYELKQINSIEVFKKRLKDYLM